MNERELFLYELDGRGYTFENMTWLGNCFEDNFLNMAWEMWCASASREGFKLVPVEPTSELSNKLEDMASSQPSYYGLDIYKVAIGELDYDWKVGTKPIIEAA